MLQCFQVCAVGILSLGLLYWPPGSWKRTICDKVINVAQFTSMPVSVDGVPHFLAMHSSTIRKFNSHWLTHSSERLLVSTHGYKPQGGECGTSTCTAEEDTDGFPTWHWGGTNPGAQLFWGLWIPVPLSELLLRGLSIRTAGCRSEPGSRAVK